jgi:hypothetical protein
LSQKFNFLKPFGSVCFADKQPPQERQKHMGISSWSLKDSVKTGDLQYHEVKKDGETTGTCLAVKAAASEPFKQAGLLTGSFLGDRVNPDWLEVSIPKLASHVREAQETLESKLRAAGIKSNSYDIYDTAGLAGGKAR